MQIEESFRDVKNHRHGWSLQHVGCRTTKRVEVLLLLAALAMVALNAVGRATAALGMERRYQANTIRTRRVLSDFVLGKRVLANRQPIPSDAIQRALDEIAAVISAHFPTPVLE